MQLDKKINLGLIFGGRSGEHEVSLLSAKSVLEVVDRQKYDITLIGISRDGKWYSGDDVHSKLASRDISGLTPVVLIPEPGNAVLYRIETIHNQSTLVDPRILDVVFPVLHGTYGEDGTLQGLLEMADIAYVGAGVLGSSVGMDKGLFKYVMSANQIPVLDFLIITRKELEQNAENTITKIEEKLAYPIFTKPANLGSSVGISKCHSRGDLLEGLMDAASYDRRILVEQGINGRDIEVSVLGNENPRASIAGEIRPVEEFYSYFAKYVDDKTALIIPAEISLEDQITLQNLAIKVYKAIDCAGLARVDFLLDKDTGKFYVNEINTIPGFTNISMYPKLWGYAGISYASVINSLIDLAIERKAERDRTIRSYGRNP